MVLSLSLALLSCTDSVQDTALPDRDGDGVADQWDCAPDDPSSPSLEVCDGVDNDCDGLQDEGFDEDGDGVADCLEPCPIWVDASAEGWSDGSQETPFATIGSALRSVDGLCQELSVLPGDYQELVDLGELEVQLRSVYGPEVTFITAPQIGSVMRITGGQSTKTVVSGFTLRGGTGTPGDGLRTPEGFRHGGGLYVVDSSPILQDLVLSDNHSTGRGGGALLIGWSGALLDSVLVGNTVQAYPQYAGAGLFLYQSDGLVQGCLFQDNQAVEPGADGGGLMIWEGAPRVVANRFVNNLAGGSGGGLRSADAQVQVLNNLFYGNDPEGLRFSYDDSGLVANNCVLDSVLDGMRTQTSGSYSGPGPQLEMLNNLISGSGRYGVRATGSYSISWRNNLVWGSGEQDYRVNSGWEEGSENLSVDPLFEQTDGLWSPLSGSPLIDAGENLAQRFGGDLYGAQRPVDWDIGCVEFVP